MISLIKISKFVTGLEKGHVLSPYGKTNFNSLERIIQVLFNSNNNIIIYLFELF